MMPVFRSRTLLWILCSAVLLAPAHGIADPAGRVLEEVVVISQRIEQSAQDTPISLATLDADDMAMRGIGSVAEIEAQVPNFVIDAFPSSNQTLRLFIRGIGITDVQITQDPAVGVYLDGVYLARSTGLASDVAELARIEVLRGPQGTLYGRNTTGGALNLVTERPDPEAIAFTQELGGGNRDRLLVRTAINLPLGDSHALRLAALGRREDGFVSNRGVGGGFGDRRAEGYRLDWRWLASDAVTVDYSWDKSRVESHNYTPQAVLPGIPGGTPADAAIISSRRFVTYTRDRLERLSTSVPLQPTDTDIQGHALHVQWELDAIVLKSITAWRELGDASYIDFASGASAEYRVDFSAITLGADSAEPVAYDTVRTRLEQEQFSQEFQLFLERDAFSLTAGLYYFEEQATENWFPLHHIFSFPVVETGDTGQAVNIRAEDNRIDNDALAAYGQFTWRAIEDWRFTLGLRYSRDERAVRRNFRQDNYVDFGNRVLGPFETIDFQARASDDFSDTSFSLIAEHDLSTDTRLYAKLVEAYKSGGFNTRDPDPQFFAQGFDEEKNRTLELGLKAEWLQRALRFNVALFRAEFEDMQLNFLLPDSISDTRVFNSGSATLSGVELDLTGFLGRGLLARFSYAYLDSEIEDVRDPFSGELRSFGFDNAPQNSASLNLDYRFDPRSYGTWYANINASYVDTRRQHDALLRIDDYSLLNGRFGLAQIPLPAGELNLSAWVKNVLDEDYVNFTIGNLPHASRAVLWGEPRRWGIDLRYQY
jgi:iron complex outermembrane receptor protein